MDLMQKYPEIALFFTPAIGFFIGKEKFGKFSFGGGRKHAGARLLVGRFDIEISEHVPGE